jgi:hypothetical protein
LPLGHISFKNNINPMTMVTIYSTRFANGNTIAAESHVKNFDELCDKVN